MAKPNFSYVKYIIILILLSFLVYPYLIWIPAKETIRSTPTQRCSNAIFHLSRAIENYNMDNITFIEKVNDEVIDILKEKSYLKNDWPNIDKYDEERKKCKYTNYRNLTEDGIIYCEYHGSAPTKTNGLIPPCDELIKLRRNEAIKAFFKSNIVSIILIILIILVAIFL